MSLRRKDTDVVMGDNGGFGFGYSFSKIIRHFSLVIMILALLVLPFEKRGSPELVVVVLVLIINAATLLATYLFKPK
jgi:hypothetical protein